MGKSFDVWLFIYHREKLCASHDPAIAWSNQDGAHDLAVMTHDEDDLLTISALTSSIARLTTSRSCSWVSIFNASSGENQQLEKALSLGMRVPSTATLEVVSAMNQWMTLTLSGAMVRMVRAKGSVQLDTGVPTLMSCMIVIVPAVRWRSTTNDNES